MVSLLLDHFQVLGELALRLVLFFKAAQLVSQNDELSLVNTSLYLLELHNLVQPCFVVLKQHFSHLCVNRHDVLELQMTTFSLDELSQSEVVKLVGLLQPCLEQNFFLSLLA